MTGYLHSLYAESLAEFGDPRELPLAGGWVLEREIPGTGLRDAMGGYPLFCCRDWQSLPRDLEELKGSLVSLTLVADPFGDYSRRDLAKCFDRAVVFKEHYVVDYREPLRISKHHRYYSKRASARLAVSAGEAPAGFAAEWTTLYAALAKRHRLSGVKAFSPEAFRIQMEVPGLVVFRATDNGVLVGAHLWYVQGETAYSHLAAAADRAYEHGWSYATYAAAVEHFQGKVRRLDLGAGAGSGGDAGLSRFKQGWANACRPAWLCGTALDPGRYRRLSAGMPETTYFPAYRSGELL